MIKIEHTEVFGWEAAIRGMRNPYNSWDKSDSKWGCIDKGRTFCTGDCGDWCTGYQYIIGEADLELMCNLAKFGDDHGKFLRMINVTCDITAPLYWWKEFSTYKVGTVANSCSTMHKIHAKEFTLDDFSHEHLVGKSIGVLENLIDVMNLEREHYLCTKDKDCWWQIIQLIPTSYNQKRTVQLNYQVLKNMYHARKAHKLDEWREFCKWIETLPYFREICLEEQQL